jgi:hypothetical protein
MASVTFWAVLFGGVTIALVASVLFKTVTGRDLDPPHDDDGHG